MKNNEDGTLFPRYQPKRKSNSLTSQEIAILRLADAYGISSEAAVKLILRLRVQKKATSAKKCKDTTVDQNTDSVIADITSEKGTLGFAQGCAFNVSTLKKTRKSLAYSTFHDI